MAGGGILMDGLFFCEAAQILPGAHIRETEFSKKTVPRNLLLFAGTENIFFEFGKLKFHKKLLDF